MKLKNGWVTMLLVAVSLAGGGHAVAQAIKHEPDFTLTISTDDRRVLAQKDMDISVKVTEKNISSHTVNAGRPKDPGDWYAMSVLLDGHPAPITERYREILNPEKSGPNVLSTGDGASSIRSCRARLGSLKFHCPHFSTLALRANTKLRFQGAPIQEAPMEEGPTMSMSSPIRSR